MNNKIKKSVQHIKDVLETYHGLTGSEHPAIVGDLLIDLRHWCKIHKYSFAKALKQSKVHFKFETTHLLKFRVRLTRDMSQSCDVEVMASDEKRANAQVESMVDNAMRDFKWELDDGNCPEVYITNTEEI
jgi:hypothetical protein